MTSATYEPFGPVTTIAFGNGTTQTLSWTTRYFPNENKLSASSTLADYGYAEDPVGNITAVTDKVNSAYNRMFKSDDLNRLTMANSGASLWGTASNNGYTYDLMGNITTVQLGTAHTEAFTYQPGTGGSLGLPKINYTNEVIAPNPSVKRVVTYDNFGNETSEGSAPYSTFTYSARELLGSDSAGVQTYYYNGFRQRVQTLPGGIVRGAYNFFFDQNQNLIEKIYTTLSQNIKEIWFGDRPVAQVDTTGTHWTFADHLGTPLIETSPTPAITWQVEAPTYGRVFATRVNTAGASLLAFPGQSYDFSSERNYNNARWYHPVWGRYTQSDTLGARKNPEIYGYGMDDPAMWTDSRGLSPSNGCIPMPILVPDPPVFIPICSRISFGPHGEFQANVYGKFCGPGYAFSILGLPEQDYPATAYDKARGDKSDFLDNCCRNHDGCLARNAQGPSACHLQPNAATCTCDHQMHTCLSQVKPQNPAQALLVPIFLRFFVATPGVGPNCPTVKSPVPE